MKEAMRYQAGFDITPNGQHERKRIVDFEGIHELPSLKNKIGVFKDREHAGALLGDMLSGYSFDNGIVFAIPSGGVPVGKVVANRLGFPLDVAVVSKITLPWNTEAGYGAVAFDGTCTMNRILIDHLPLSESQIEEGIRKTRSKVSRRSRMFRKDGPFPDLKGRPVILVDDGLASGFTITAIMLSVALTH